MKIIHYKPLGHSSALPKSPDTLPVEILSQVIFQNTSMEEALEELRREGFRAPNGKKIFTGMRDLLEKIKEIREALSAKTSFTAFPIASSLSDGPVKSGASMNKDEREGSLHLLPEKMGGTPPLTHQKALTPTADRVNELEKLEKSLKRVYWGYDPKSIDDARLEELLGKDYLEKWQLIKNLDALIFNQGLMEHGTTGLKLTSLGLQKIARNILKEIFKLRKVDPLCRRLSAQHATEPYLTEGSRPYRFGDPPLINPSQSLLNAIMRTGAKLPIKLQEKDFSVYQKEVISRAATVVLLDLSRSMRFENRYIAAKKVTLALHGLIQERYPHDRIAVVGFSTKAYTIKNAEIPFLTWDETNPYTNMEEALDLSQKMLSRYKGYRRQVFLITDGEPTAHREKGYLFFQFPPHQKTLAKTLKRLQGLARHGIATSIFLLSQEKERVTFVHQMAQRCGGRLFHIQSGELGWCLLMDFLEKKSRWL